MDAAREDRLERLIQRAVALRPEQRAAFLAEACGADAELRATLEALLAHADEAPEFLDRVAGRAVARVAGAAVGDACDGCEGRGADALVGRRVAHFQVLEKLGGGGMGRVYRALDLRLDRTVALKFLPPHLSADADARQRFTHEAKSASALDHPNICAIHDIGEADAGQLFIAMAYYAGDTLKKKIARGPLPVREALDYGAQVAEGLRRAHDAGIVHRDIKPANVMVTDLGQVKIVDFGLAKVAGADLTKEGATVGTVAYMSPEQTRGGPVDARTDVWSLGVLLYEMLTGRRPFQCESDETLIFAIRHDAPAPVRDSRAEVPAALDAVVSRCLAKDPARRYQRAHELLADLDALRGGAAVPARPAARARRALRSWRVRTGVVAAVLAASALGALRWRQALGSRDGRAVVGAAAQARRSSLAVLPLKNYSGDFAQEYFADGMTDELTATLTKLEGLRVIAHQSMLQFKHSDRSVPEIARLLDVRYVVDGSVLQDGDRIRISASLIDPATNTPIWGESFERERRDVLALQREVALAIAGEIEITLTPQDRERLGDAPKVDPGAFDLYIKGTQARYRMTSDAFREAADYFARAVAADSSYAPPYAGLAFVYALSGDRSRARRFADKALTLNADLAEPHMVLGMVRQFFDRDWVGAEEELRHAIRLNPGYAEAHHELSMLLMRRRRFDEALGEARRTLYLAPTSARFQLGVAEVYLYSGRYREALSAADKAHGLDSSAAGPYLITGMAYGQLGEFARAEAALERCVELWPEEACRGELGYVYAISGKLAEALELLEALKQERGRSGELTLTSARGIAEIYAGLGEREQALTWLDRRVQEGGGGVYLAINPALRSLRGEPRFQALLKRVGLDEPQ